MVNKIKQIEIEAFRGISVKRAITFILNKNPCSTLIVGDNGSGKSSIIDAIEFATQAKVHNTSSINSNRKVEVFNLFDLRKPYTKLILDDDKEYIRTIDTDSDGKKHFDQAALAQYRIAPFILRRQNILQFWNTPQIQRQIVFLNYNLDSSSNEKEQLGESFLDRIKELEEERQVKKKERRESINTICSIKRIRSETVPLSKKDFYEWAKKNILLGMSLDSVKSARRKGIRITIPSSLEEAVEKIIQSTKDIEKIDVELNKYKPKKTTTNKDIIKAIFHELSTEITKTFLSLSTLADEISEIIIHVAEESDVSLSFEIVLANGKHIIPEQILSEANLDLLAFVVFIEMTKKAVALGQAPVLVLDDVFQSIDSGIRVKIVNYLICNLSSWQLIITVHDRLWKEQLIELFHINSTDLCVYEIVNWNSVNGVDIQSDSMSLDETLNDNINDGSINEIISNSSLLLEKICSQISYRLPISVTRRKNDKYTLGDLWPGIFSKLKKYSITKDVSKVNELIYLRNMIGGHYNEWSLSLTRKEAIDFALAVLNLYEKVYCKECGYWIEEVKIGNKSIGHSCRCGKNKYESTNLTIAST